MLVDLLKIKKSTYILVKPQIAHMLSHMDQSDIVATLSLIALATSCPVVIVYHYAAEILNKPELLEQVKRIEQFYKYEVI